MARDAIAAESDDGPDEPDTARLSDYLALGRKNQKLRTFDSLVTIAADLIRSGRPVSVTEVADAARVSRTTAYRYFPTSELLAAHASLAAANAIDARELTVISEGTGAPEEKLDAVIAGSHAMTAHHEAAFRSLVRFTVEGTGKGQGVPKRPSFRRTWVEASLASLKKELGPQRHKRLTSALCLLIGIESTIVLSDICQLPPDEAREVKRWAGKLLLESALKEARQGRDVAAKPKASLKSPPKSAKRAAASKR